jgi:hypothetical protein
MEGGNTLVHRAGIINAQLLHDMDSMAVDYLFVVDLHFLPFPLIIR